MPLQILHIDYGLAFGGSIVSLSEMIRGLYAVASVESTVLVCQPVDSVRHLYPAARLLPLHPRVTYRDRARLDDLIAGSAAARAVQWPLRKAFAAIDTLHDRWLARRIAEVGQSRGVTLVHANNGWSASATRAARLLGATCVTHFRGYERPSTNPRRTLPRFSADVAACVGIAPAVSASIVASGVPAEKVFTVDNPVTIDAFVVPEVRRAAVRSQHGFAVGDVVVGLFGRVIPFKGQLEFLEAVLPLLEQWPALHILIVGDEADLDVGGYGGAVRLLAASPSYAGRVVFAGYQEDVAAYYAASDLIVHCSVHPEPFGRVVVEGMAAGRPVIAMDEGGPPEIITHNTDGLLAAPRNADAMRQTLLRFRDEPGLAERLGVAARATAQRRYSPEAAARQFLSALPAHLRR